MKKILSIVSQNVNFERLAQPEVHTQLENSQKSLFDLYNESGVIVVQYLVEKKIRNINDRNVFGATVLHLASANNYESDVDWFLQHGAIVDSRTNNSATPLHWACREGHIRIVEKLVRYNADFRSIDKSFNTPYSYAIEKRHLEVQTFLEGLGVTYSSTDQQGPNVMTMARRQNSEIECNAEKHRDSLLIQGRKMYVDTFFRKSLKKINDAFTSSNTSIFISYAWGKKEDEEWTTMFVECLQECGLTVKFDKYDNANTGVIEKFIHEMDVCQYVILIATPLLNTKYKSECKEYIVQREIKKIKTRLDRDHQLRKNTVFPILLNGNKTLSIPDIFYDFTYTDMTQHQTDIPLFYEKFFELITHFFNIPLHNKSEPKTQQFIEIKKEFNLYLEDILQTDPDLFLNHMHEIEKEDKRLKEKREQDILYAFNKNTAIDSPSETFLHTSQNDEVQALKTTMAEKDEEIKKLKIKIDKLTDKLLEM